MTRADRISALHAALAERILILDGATGTMYQRYGLGEADYRGDAFANHGQDLAGDNELLTLSQPTIVREVHDAFIRAGADIIETNTFGATRIAQADYGLEEEVPRLNFEAARI